MVTGAIRLSKMLSNTIAKAEASETANTVSGTGVDSQPALVGGLVAVF